MRLLTILAAYRVAWLIANERGPFDLAERLRTAVYDRYGDESWQFAGITCPLCVSFWTSLALLWAPRWVVTWLGIAGGVMVAHRVLDAVETAMDPAEDADAAPGA